MITKEELKTLKEGIKVHAAHGRQLRQTARTLHGLPRAQKRAEANSVGVDARYLQLAYAFLRRRPYKTVEQKVHTWNRLSGYDVKKIVKIIESHVAPEVRTREQLGLYTSAHVTRWIDSYEGTLTWGAPKEEASHPKPEATHAA